MRDLGGMGEAALSYWCAQVGITCNKAAIDKTGWDFLVELPLGVRPTTSTAQGDAIECKIQVKATNGNLGKLSIKLSNLYRFAITPIPCFVLFIEFDKKDTPQRSYLVHIDEALISKILERKYEFEHKKGIIDLHDRSMTISYSDGHRLESSSGDALMDRILKYVPYGNARYAIDKSKHIESTGYEEEAGRFAFTANGLTAIQDFIDASLGLPRKIEVHNFEIRESRFGIPANQAKAIGGTGFVELLDVQPHSAGFVGFSESMSSPKIAFPCHFYVPPAEWITREDLLKIRVDAKLFELNLVPKKGSARITFKIYPDADVRVTDLKKYVHLTNLLSAAKQKNPYLSLDRPSNPSIYICIKNSEIQAFHPNFTKAIESAKEICDNFETSEVAVASLAAIDRYERSIVAFNSILKQEPKAYRFVFKPIEPFDQSKVVAALFAITTMIGAHQYGMILLWSGYARKMEDGEYELLTTKSLVMQKLIPDHLGKINTDHLKEEIDRIARDLDDEIIVFSDYSVHGPASPNETE